jgi:hypothetical protein
MEMKIDSLDQLKMKAQQTVATAPQKVLTGFTYLLEAQREVLEMQLGLLEDALKIVKKFAPPAPPTQGS